jgi:MFS family permease
MTVTMWLILIMAAIGFAFDTYVLLILPPVLPPALRELLPNAPPGSAGFNLWRGLVFWVPAIAGGVFGLLGGYLTDRLGRRRVLTWSILVYAVSAFAAGFSTSMTMFLILRCLTFVGVCVEFVAAVAWLAELFPNPHQRERALGYAQAFGSVGGLLVSGVFLLANHWAADWGARGILGLSMPLFLTPYLGSIGNAHAAWRYTLISGVIPAIPLILIRPFLPESPVWQQRKLQGSLRRPSLRELFAPGLARTTILTTIMVACSFGAAFGAIQQMPQIVPALPDVKTQVHAALEADAAKRNSLPDKERQAAERQVAQTIQNRATGQLQMTQEIGGLVGRFLLALLVVPIVSRRSLLRIFVVPGLILMPLVFGYASLHNQVLFTLNGLPITLFHVGVFLAGLVTVAQFSFWGNYLPLAYPVHLRGTGESMAANIGGRLIGTSFAAVTSVVSGLLVIPGSDDPTRVALTAAGVAAFVFLVLLLTSFWLPEVREAQADQ